MTLDFIREDVMSVMTPRHIYFKLYAASTVARSHFIRQQSRSGSARSAPPSRRSAFSEKTSFYNNNTNKDETRRGAHPY